MGRLSLGLVESVRFQVLDRHSGLRLGPGVRSPTVPGVALTLGACPLRPP